MAQPEAVSSRNQFMVATNKSGYQIPGLATDHVPGSALQMAVCVVYGDIRTRAAVYVEIAKGNTGFGHHDLVA